MKKLLAAVLMSLPLLAIADASVYRSMVPEIPGSEAIYDAYIDNGYIPVDAMILTNWDIMEGLNLIMGEQKPVDEGMKQDVQDLRDSYTKSK